MREPLFTDRNQAAQRHLIEGDAASEERVRLAAGLHRATNLAIESAFRHGIDMPVGAVALQGSEIVGRGYANDRRFSANILHAEVMATVDARFTLGGGANGEPVDTLITTLEPCNKCQDELAAMPGLKKVAFAIERRELVERGLVNRHRLDVFERANNIGLPYKVEIIDDDELRAINLAVLDYVNRDTESGEVFVNTTGLNQALTALNG